MSATTHNVIVNYYHPRANEERAFFVENFCPLCNESIFVDPAFAYELPSMPNIGDDLHILIANCPKCGCAFDSLYKSIDSTSDLLAFESFLPPKPLPVSEIPKTISKLSPIFCDTYNQAISSIEAGYDQLVGLGLRKALEFLVKDYLISITSDIEEQNRISELSLAKAIDKLDNEQIKKFAHAARIFGNDETHYLKKFNFDIQNFRLIIEFVIKFIDQEIKKKELEFAIDQALSPKSPKRKPSND